MSDRTMTRRPRCPSAPCVERLEDRCLWSASVLVPPAVHRPAVERVTPVAGHVRPADDDGDSGDAGSSGDDAGTAGGDGGGSTDDGSSDGSSDDDGGVAANSPGSDAGGSTDASTPTVGGTTDSGGSSADTTPTTDDNARGTSGGNAADDGADPTILYPTGDPYDDSLYDDGGGTEILVTGPVGAADFGGAVHVRLPPHPVAGDAGTATVDVFNTGGRALGRMELAVGASPDGSAAAAVPVADEHVPVHLGHDRVAVYRVPFRLPATLPAGTYRFLALVDAGNDFAETDEANNVAVGPAVAIAAAVPDLSVSGVGVARRLRAGRPAAVTVRLAEAGTVDESGSITVAVTAEPVAGGASVTLATATRAVHVGRGRPAAATVRFTVPMIPAGRYRLTVQVTPVSAADADAADKSAAATMAVIA